MYGPAVAVALRADVRGYRMKGERYTNFEIVVPDRFGENLAGLKEQLFLVR